MVLYYQVAPHVSTDGFDHFQFKRSFIDSLHITKNKMASMLFQLRYTKLNLMKIYIGTIDYPKVGARFII